MYNLPTQMFSFSIGLLLISIIAGRVEVTLGWSVYPTSVCVCVCVCGRAQAGPS